MYNIAGETAILTEITTMRSAFFHLLVILLSFPLTAQERPLNTGLSNDEQYSFIGMMIADIIDKYGAPRTVASARGIELWQDDVVFQYTGVDFYIYKDRVWQVKFNTTHGISNGDRKAAALLALGETAKDMGDHALLSIKGKDWPLSLKIIFNEKDIVTAIFLYRPDY